MLGFETNKTNRPREWLSFKKVRDNFLIKLRGRPPNIRHVTEMIRIKLRDTLAHISARGKPARRQISSLVLVLTMIFNPLSTAVAMASPISIDNILETVLIDGIPLEDYDSQKLEYVVELPQGARTVPEVEFITSNLAKTDFDVQQVTKIKTVPFTESLVIRKNGLVERAYTVKFTIEGLNENHVRTTQLNAPEQIYMQLGETVAIEHTTNPDASIQIVGYNLPLWDNPDTPLFSVDERGQITALNAGEGILTLESRDRLKGESPEGNINKQVVIRVLAEDETNADRIEVSETQKTLIVGEEYQVDYKVLPLKSSDKTVEWTSSDSEIASIDTLGLVEARQPGSVTLTGINKEYNLTVEVHLEILELGLESITISNKVETLQVGETQKLEYSVYPEEASSGELLWVSDKPDIVEVSSTGLLTAKGEGKATISLMSSKGPRDETSIEIQPQIVGQETEVVLDTLKVIEVKQLKIPVEPEAETAEEQSNNTQSEQVIHAETKPEPRERQPESKGLVEELIILDKDTKIEIERENTNLVSYKEGKRTNNDHTIPPPGLFERDVGKLIDELNVNHNNRNTE